MKSDYKIIVGVIVGTVVMFGGLIWLMSRSQTPQQVSLATLVGADPHQKGALADEAVLTIVEFSDFQCPACRAASPIIDQFVKEYPNEVRFVYRHFPLASIHPNARLAAIATEIAAEENSFWAYHNLLFENQSAWSDVNDPTDLFISYAKELEMDPESFALKLKDTNFANRVSEDEQLAGELNLNSTPSLFYNGTLESGVPTLNFLENQLQEAKRLADN